MTRFTIFLFFFTLSTMAQITITGRVTDYQKTPYVDFPVTNGRDTVRTDSEGRYKIEAKLWDVIYFYRLDRKFRSYEIDTPHQVYNHTMDRIYRNSGICIEYTYLCGIVFIRNDNIVKKRDREAFKEELRSGQFYKYSVMDYQELSKHYGYLGQYGLVAYTKDYYNEEYKE